MFEIVGGRKSFFQWDLNQKLAVFDDSITEVHFCNKSADCALVCEVYNDESGARVVNVPNILLQANRCIRAYGVAADHTEHYARFEVISRSKPADYVYTETEVKTFSTLEQRMDELEATVSAEGIAQAVEDYLKANPVEAGATAEERAQITQNAKDISGLYEQAAGFALKSEIPSVEGLATNGYVNEIATGCLKQVNNMLVPYALKEDVPSIEGLASEQYVDNAIANIDLPTGGGEGEVVEIAKVEFTEEVQFIFQPFDYTLYSMIWCKITQSENTKGYYSTKDDYKYFFNGSLYNRADLVMERLNDSFALCHYNTGFGNYDSLNAISRFAGIVSCEGMTGLKLYKETKWKAGDKIEFYGRLRT